ncbi:polyprenol phosphomannose-dependent alpha 1,6 mannosyltransferase MptB [Streptoalloteichus hindustanus]|uniref:polyprenol phosphomannose-dependent alpha 1,6 mannosyltransferase MptB n=1 Tax=Streptoalloteichus hindustanus TaxID=2017 RepID=UPI00389A3B1F
MAGKAVGRVARGTRAHGTTATEGGQDAVDDQRRAPAVEPAAGRIGTPEEPAPLDRGERRQLDVVRRFGTVGSLLLAVGALGAGANPVLPSVQGLRLLGLPARLPTASLAVAYAGLLMVVLAWLALGRLARPGRPRLISRSQLDRTLVMWAAPLALAPPMFSRDVYSYLAQSEIAARGLDPYLVGPVDALGPDHPLTRGVPNIWRDTPAPYGPLFFSFARVITWVAGDNVELGILLHRALALAGLALIVWALPRLARRCGVQPVSALWLGALNPLVLFHLISGVHNEALAIGMMLAGFEVALRNRRVAAVVGALLITCAAAVKISVAPALGFLGAALARRRGGRISDLVKVALLLTVVFVAGLVATSLLSGLGFGWTGTLDTANKVKSWMSPATALGMLGGGIGIALGLGNHSDAVIALTRAIGMGLGGLAMAALLWLSFRSWGRHRVREPLACLGVSLGLFILLGPVVHPWYLLWAAIPLAAATNSARFRTAATGISVFLALMVPPPGSTFDNRVYVLWQAVVAAVIVVLLLLWFVRRVLLREQGFPTAAPLPPTR